MIKALVQLTLGNDIAGLVLSHYNRSVWRKHDSIEIVAAFLSSPVTVMPMPGPKSAVLVALDHAKRILLIDHDKVGYRVFPEGSSGVRVRARVKSNTRSGVCYGTTADGQWIITRPYIPLTAQSISASADVLTFHNINSSIPSKEVTFDWKINRVLNHRHAVGFDMQDIVVFDISDMKEIQRISHPLDSLRYATATSPFGFHVDNKCYVFNGASQRYEETVCKCVDDLCLSSLPLKFAAFKTRSLSNMHANPLPLHQSNTSSTRSIVICRRLYGDISCLIYPISKRILSAVELPNGTVVTASPGTRRSKICLRFYRPPGSY